MELSTDCYDCLLGNITSMARRTVADDRTQCEIIRRALDFLVHAGTEMTPPEFAGAFHRILRDYSGEEDAYRQEKHDSTLLAIELLDQVHELIQTHHDQFDAVVRAVIGGNIIDYGADRFFTLEKARSRLLEVFSLELDATHVAKLKEAMDRAERIFYIADNCGEAVFDRLLIERYQSKITLGVRGLPILNDITPAEVASSGLDLVPLLDTGDDTPGVSERRTSSQFVEAMTQSDLVIAKGQGNFETLEWFNGPIVHLLRVKCPVIAEKFNGAPLGTLQIHFRNF